MLRPWRHQPLHRLCGGGLFVGLGLSPGVDARKIFVVGIAFTFGLSLDLLPSLYAGIGAWLRPLFPSSLTLSTALAGAPQPAIACPPGSLRMSLMEPRDATSTRLAG